MLFRRNTHSARNKRMPPAEPPKKSGRFSAVDWGKMRLWGVALFFSVLWLALWGRAFHLQVIQGPELAAMAKRQHMTKEVILGMRGNILDRNSNVLARSVDSQSVWVNPAAIKDKTLTATTLAKILDLPQAKILAMLQEDKKFVWLQRKISDKQARLMKDLHLPGVGLTAEFDRLYPYESLAGQLIGFVDVDDKGIEGLEKAFENRLSGQKARQFVQRDASGKRMVVRGAEDTSDLRGQDIRLTIDTQVQFFAEEALAEQVAKFEAKWGGCIVVDVPTGEVLAWAQFPFFNPNKANNYPAVVRRNRLSMDALEQGSTIKSFLVAAALEEKAVTSDTIIFCENGKWKLRTATIHDTHAYKNLPVSKILHVSSNIGAAKIGMKIGAAKYHSYLTRLGFGQRTDLPLAGESRGILRPSQQWQEIDLAATSFGQSFSATLAQMAQAYLILAGDGTYKPLTLVTQDQGREDTPEPTPVPSGALLESITTPAAHTTETQTTGDKPAPVRVFSAQTLRQVREMLREVVEEEGGTGSQARIAGIMAGGKTGTAQKADRTGKYGAGRVASFVGMVPIENPRYLICVLLDEPTKNQYGGIVAAPVFSHVALRTLAYQGMLPDSEDPKIKALTEKEATSKNTATKGAKQKGIATKVAKNATQPASATTPLASRAPGGTNNPKPIEPAPSPVGPGKVPTVVGMGIRTAITTFARHGVMPELVGKGGVVVRQLPEPGSAWPPGEKKCTLWLEERQS